MTSKFCYTLTDKDTAVFKNLKGDGYPFNDSAWTDGANLLRQAPNVTTDGITYSKHELILGGTNQAVYHIKLQYGTTFRPFSNSKLGVGIKWPSSTSIIDSDFITLNTSDNDWAFYDINSSNNTLWLLETPPKPFLKVKTRTIGNCKYYRFEDFTDDDYNDAYLIVDTTNGTKPTYGGSGLFSYTLWYRNDSLPDVPITAANWADFPLPMAILSTVGTARPTVVFNSTSSNINRSLRLNAAGNDYISSFVAPVEPGDSNDLIFSYSLRIVSATSSAERNLLSWDTPPTDSKVLIAYDDSTTTLKIYIGTLNFGTRYTISRVVPIGDMIILTFTYVHSTNLLVYKIDSAPQNFNNIEDTDFVSVDLSGAPVDLETNTSGFLTVHTHNDMTWDMADLRYDYYGGNKDDVILIHDTVKNFLGFNA